MAKIYMKLAALCLVICVAGAIAGCNFSGGKTGVLRYAIGGEPESIDPRKSTSIAAANIQAQLFEGLTALDANHTPVPAVAETWSVSADGLTYTFQLRRNARWSNGDLVTARDFEYAWKSALSPDLASSYAYQLFYLRNGEAYNQQKATADQVGVRALNDYTLEVLLERPTSYFLTLTSFHTFYPVHMKTVEANPRWAGNAADVVGNGPFKLVKWVHDSKMELVKNDQYWDKAKVKLDKIEVVLVDAAPTILTMFESGQLDMAENVPIAEIPRLLQENKLKVFPYLGTYYYAFNLQQAPFDNLNVRKALTLAVDRAAIVNKITRGGQKPAFAIVPQGLKDSQPAEDFRQIGGDYFSDNDIGMAQKLLAAAGYPGGAGLPPITLLYNTSESHKAIAEAIQEMWRKNLGIQVNLVNQEWKVFVDNLEKHNYQVARDGWVGDYPDPMTFLDLFESTSGNNVPGYSNGEYDRVIRMAKNTQNQSVRMQALHIAEKMLMEDAIIMPLYFYTNTVLIKPNVKGYGRSIMGTVSFKEAYVE